MHESLLHHRQPLQHRSKSQLQSRYARPHQNRPRPHLTLQSGLPSRYHKARGLPFDIQNRASTEQAGGLHTALTAYVSARIISSLRIFNAGGVVRPRPYTTHDPHHPAMPEALYYHNPPQPTTLHSPPIAISRLSKPNYLHAAFGAVKIKAIDSRLVS